jgi:hypothetical protein
LIVAELIGISLVAYGIWFAAEGVKRLLNGNKDWWRPVRGTRRYPYPVAGILLGICFILMGLVFALHNVWEHVRILVPIGIGLFALVLFAGIVQPRFAHPRWYANLEDRYGRKGVLRLKKAAHQVEDPDWREIAASETAFNAWVNQTMPAQRRPTSRGYKGNTDSK